MNTRLCRGCGGEFSLPRGRAFYCSPECRCGTQAGYMSGCRCVDCRAAHARRSKLDRCIPSTRLPAVGYARRLQALAALGYDWLTLAREMGVSRSQVSMWATSDTEVNRVTAELIVTTYDRLSMVLPPTDTTGQRNTVSRARNRAQAERWAPPLAWDEDAIDDPDAHPVGRTGARTGFDPSVVERILSGEYDVPATPLERREVARRWAADDRSLNDLGRLTGWRVARYFRLSDDQEAVSA